MNASPMERYKKKKNRRKWPSWPWVMKRYLLTILRLRMMMNVMMILNLKLYENLIDTHTKNKELKTNINT